jgi:hypothetical protein
MCVMALGFLVFVAETEFLVLLDSLVLQVPFR